MPAPIFTDLDSLLAVLNRDRRAFLGTPGWDGAGRPYRLVMSSLFADPLHDAHAACLREAKWLGTHLLAVVNGRAAAVRKKGYEFMPEDARAAVVAELRPVDYVLLWPGSTVEEVIKRVRPDAFAKGGDRSDLKSIDPAELTACYDVKCVLTLGVGGADKVRSSSDMVRRAALALGHPPPA